MPIHPNPNKQVPGTRFTDKYLSVRMNQSRSGYSYRSSVDSSSKHSTSASTSSHKPPLSPPHSPPRKVVTDFAAFGAPKTASVFGTAVASTPFSLAGNKAAFGSMRATRGGMMDDDEDEDEEREEEEDDGRQKVMLKEGSITLDQVG